MAQIELSFRKPASNGDPPGPRVVTVSQLVRAADRLLEAKFSNICVEGEISNFTLTGSGHAFFTLKDEVCSLPVAMWKSALEGLRFRLADGQCIRATGRLGVFGKQGKFQFYADRAEPAGLGSLMIELEQRKAKLAAEGLFAPERKRPLPRWPRIVGVVTSAHGAAIHDILEVARQRCRAHILLAPAAVQGPDAPRTMIRALGRLARWPGVDVIIIGRGGGSVEDLWAFNDERLARAIAACPIPVVSAVGHEVDVSICDLVADVRAATPSHAAELVVPDVRALQSSLEAFDRRLTRAIERVALDQRGRLDRLNARLLTAGRGLTAARAVRLKRLEQALQRSHPRAQLAIRRRRLERLAQRVARCPHLWMRSHRSRLADARSRLLACARTLSRCARTRLGRAAATLGALSPLAVLERGYALVFTEKGLVVRSAAEVGEGETLRVRLCRGQLEVRVTGREPVED